MTFLLFSNTFSQTVDVYSFLASAFLCVWPSPVHFSPRSFQVMNKTCWSLYISPICRPFTELSYSFSILFKSSKFKVNWIPVLPNPDELLLDFPQYKWCRTVTSTAYLNPAAPHLGSSDSTNPLKPYQLGVGKVLLGKRLNAMVRICSVTRTDVKTSTLTYPCNNGEGSNRLLMVLLDRTSTKNSKHLLQQETLTQQLRWRSHWGRHHDINLYPP